MSGGGMSGGGGSGSQSGCERTPSAASPSLIELLEAAAEEERRPAARTLAPPGLLGSRGCAPVLEAGWTDRGGPPRPSSARCRRRPAVTGRSVLPSTHLRCCRRSCCHTMGEAGEFTLKASRAHELLEQEDYRGSTDLQVPCCCAAGASGAAVGAAAAAHAQRTAVGTPACHGG